MDEHYQYPNCKKLLYAVLLSAIKAVCHQEIDSDYAEYWLKNSYLAELGFSELGIDKSYIKETIEKLKEDGVMFWGTDSIVSREDYFFHRDNIAEARRHRGPEPKRKRFNGNGKGNKNQS